MKDMPVEGVRGNSPTGIVNPGRGRTTGREETSRHKQKRSRNRRDRVFLESQDRHDTIGVKKENLKRPPRDPGIHPETYVSPTRSPSANRAHPSGSKGVTGTGPNHRHSPFRPRGLGTVLRSHRSCPTEHPYPQGLGFLEKTTPDGPVGGLLQHKVRDGLEEVVRREDTIQGQRPDPCCFEPGHTTTDRRRSPIASTVQPL